MAQVPKLKKLPGIGKARVLIVDDQPIVRERLAQLIRKQPDLTLAGDADDPRIALQLIARSEPGLVVTGLALKNSHGLEFIKDLHVRYPHIRVLVFSMYDESLHAERAIRAGASGFISKRECTSEVIRAIRCVLDGEIYLSQQVTGATLRRFFAHSPRAFDPELEQLSDRELEVLEFIGHGRGSRQIADALHLDPKTVETYRSRIKVKLKLNSAFELAQRAQELLQRITSARSSRVGGK